MTSLHWADYVIFVAFLGVSLAIGVYHACTGGRQKTTEEFIMADRKLRVLPTMVSLLVSYQSAIMIVGLTAEVYSYGTQAWILVAAVGYPLSTLFTERIIVPWIYPLKLTSVYTYFEIRFKSRGTRMFAAVLGLLAGLLYIGPSLFAPSVALEAATGFPMSVSIPVMALVTTAYTAMGGMRAVIWTDVFQGFVMLAGMITVLIKGAYIVGGFGSAMNELKDACRLVYPVWDPDPRLRHTVWTILIGYLVKSSYIYGLNQASVQRYSATRTLREARLVMLLNIPAVVLLECVASMMGVVAVAYFNQQQCDPISAQHVTSSNQIIPFYVKTIFASNKGFAGLFLATLYSGSLSSISSTLSACAANAWEDILQFRLSHLSEARAAAINKLLVVIFGITGAAFAFLVAVLPGPVTQGTISFVSSVLGPLLGMFILGGVFRSAEYRGTVVGAVLALILSTLLNIAGSTVQGPQRPLPPLSVEGCPAFNSSYSPEHYWTNTTTSHDEQQPTLSGIENFYAISYLYYSTFGCLVTIIIGLITSAVLRRCWPDGQHEYDRIPDELFINWRNAFTLSEATGETQHTMNKVHNGTENIGSEENAVLQKVTLIESKTEDPDQNQPDSVLFRE